MSEIKTDVWDLDPERNKRSVSFTAPAGCLSVTIENGPRSDFDVRVKFRGRGNEMLGKREKETWGLFAGEKVEIEVPSSIVKTGTANGGIAFLDE